MTYRVANRDVFEALSGDLGLAPDYTSERVAGRKSLYRIDAPKVRHALRLYRSSDLPRLLETWRREDNELTNPRGVLEAVGRNLRPSKLGRVHQRHTQRSPRCVH